MSGDKRVIFGLGGMGGMSSFDEMLERMGLEGIPEEILEILPRILGSGHGMRMPGMGGMGKSPMGMIIMSKVKPGEKCPICGEVHVPLRAGMKPGEHVHEDVCPMCGGDVAHAHPGGASSSLFDSKVILELVKSRPVGLRTVTCNERAGVNQKGHPYSVKTVKLEFRGDQ